MFMYADVTWHPGSVVVSPAEVLTSWVLLVASWTNVRCSRAGFSSAVSRSEGVSGSFLLLKTGFSLVEAPGRRVRHVNGWSRGVNLVSRVRASDLNLLEPASELFSHVLRDMMILCWASSDVQKVARDCRL